MPCVESRTRPAQKLRKISPKSTIFVANVHLSKVHDRVFRAARAGVCLAAEQGGANINGILRKHEIVGNNGCLVAVELRVSDKHYPFLIEKSSFYDTKLIISDRRFMIFECETTDLRVCHASGCHGVVATRCDLFHTEFIIFNAKFIVLNTKLRPCWPPRSTLRPLPTWI